MLTLESIKKTLPYKSLFVTALPGMGTTTFAANIANVYLENSKKVLVFTTGDYVSTRFIERVSVIRKETKIENVFVKRKTEYGNLTIIDNNFLPFEDIINYIMKNNSEIVIFEEPIFSKIKTSDVIRLVKFLNKKNIKFIFVTHIKCSHLENTDKSSLKKTNHRRATSKFEAAVVISRNNPYDFKKNDEILIYEKQTNNFKIIDVFFDFNNQLVKFI